MDGLALSESTCHTPGGIDVTMHGGHRMDAQIRTERLAAFIRQHGCEVHSIDAAGQLVVSSVVWQPSVGVAWREVEHLPATARAVRAWLGY